MLKYEYIVAIAVGSLFALMCLIATIVFLYNHNKEKKLRQSIVDSFNDKNCVGMNYDFALFDEEAAYIVSVSRIEGQLSIDDVIHDKAPTEEGMEEITGNYKPE